MPGAVTAREAGPVSKMHHDHDHHDEALRVALRPSWAIPLASAALEILVAILVTVLGIYYDYIDRLPGPLVGVGVTLLTGRWVIIGRLQWAAVQRYLQTLQDPDREIAGEAERAVRRHGRAAVLQALQDLDGKLALPAPPLRQVLPQ